MGLLTADLAAESADLYELLSVLAEPQWALPTPAAGWTVRDQVVHLAWADDAAVLAATEPGRFRAAADADMAAGMDFPDRIVAAHRGLSGAEAFGWLQRARRGYLGTFAALEPSTPLPWYGPAMSAASSVTARLMETWAHGLDVADALGVVREPTARIRHVAHIGVRTRDFAFVNNGLEPPVEEFRVDLTGPDGDVWSWGPEGASQSVRGPAYDFCELVTQRRHRDDLALRATGPDAERWLTIAQAFAGPAGGGRRPTDA